MKDTRLIMGMPVEIEIVDAGADEALEDAFAYFVSVDEQFSPYKETSEVSRMDRGELSKADASPEMREVFAIGARTKASTNGYFDVYRPDGTFDPSGVVKGWAIKNAAARLRANGCEDFMLDVGGDIAVGGKNLDGGEWSIGIRNPFDVQQVVKVVYPHGKGVATSGSYLRGAHIYDPHDANKKLDEIVSITVVGPDVMEADLYATAAFAMGKDGIAFIEREPAFEGYAIDKDGVATMTSGFGVYTKES